MISLFFVLIFFSPHLVLGCDDCDICAAAFDGAVGFEVECRFCLRWVFTLFYIISLTVS